MTLLGNSYIEAGLPLEYPESLSSLNFQGCYYDCRYWAGFYLFLRIAILIVFAFTQSGYFVILTGVLLVPIVSLLVTIRPHRENIYNVIDSVMLLTLVQLCFSAAGFSLSALNRRYETYVTIMFGIGALCPLVYASLLLIKTIAPKNLLAVTKRYILRHVPSGKKVERFQKVPEDIEE